MTGLPWWVYLLAWATPCAISWGSMFLWRGICRQYGWVDDPGGRKDHAGSIPLAGGYAALTGIAVSAALGMAMVGWGALTPSATRALAYGLEQRWGQLAAIGTGAFGMLLLGSWDDRRELSPRVKFWGQVVIATLVAAAGIRVTLFVPNVLFSYVATVFWILTITNAVNFLDNMNGLCGGLGMIASGWFAWFSIAEGQYLVGLLTLAVCGGLAGFLPFNFPKASVFLGDAGSHLVGFLLAVLAILPHFHSRTHPEPWAVVKPVFVLGVPLFDIMSVVWIRWRLGVPITRGDHNHVSHRLVRAGFSRTGAVGLLWAIAGLCGLPLLIR